MKIHHHGSHARFTDYDSHIQLLSNIEDKTGSLLPVAEFLLRVNTICAARSVLELFFCEQPPIPLFCHFSDVPLAFLRHAARGHRARGAEHAQ